MNKNNKITIISTESIALNGPRIISSYLKKNSFDVKLISLSTFNEKFSEPILRDIMELSRDSLLICFSCMSITSKKTVQLIKYLKQLNIPIIWGGIHATFDKESCLKYADIVCVGEGEKAILELAIALQKKKCITKIKNLWVKKSGKVYKNEVRHLIKDIDALPFPDYDFRNQYVLIGDKIRNMQEKYLKYGEHNPSTSVLSSAGYFITSHTTRGCPYNCEFCCNHGLKKIYKNKGNYIRQRSIRNVIHELIFLKQKYLSLGFIWFTDDDFFLRSPNKLSLFSKFYKKEINLPFLCYVNPLTFNEDKLRLLLNAGLFMVQMGVQTGSSELNKQVYNRTYGNELILSSGNIFKRYNSKMFPPIYQIMYMNPLEEEKDSLKTIKLLQKLPKPFFLQVFNMIFFPGISMYEKAKKRLDNKFNLDETYSLSYYDYVSQLKLKKRNLYLNMILHYMAGWNTKYRQGLIPSFLLKFLLHKKLINFNKKLNSISKFLFFLPTINNLLWMLPPKYRGKYLEIIIRLFKFKKRITYSFLRINQNLKSFLFFSKKEH